VVNLTQPVANSAASRLEAQRMVLHCSGGRADPVTLFSRLDPVASIWTASGGVGASCRPLLGEAAVGGGVSTPSGMLDNLTSFADGIEAGVQSLLVQPASMLHDAAGLLHSSLTGLLTAWGATSATRRCDSPGPLPSSPTLPGGADSVQCSGDPWTGHGYCYGTVDGLCANCVLWRPDPAAGEVACSDVFSQSAAHLIPLAREHASRLQALRPTAQLVAEVAG
jgi:hypothetical protein